MNESESTPLTLVFFGISGSGKGTQAELLTKQIEAATSRTVWKAEMGGLLRQYVEGETFLGKKMKEGMAQGVLLPSFVPSFLVPRALDASFDPEQHLMLDGVIRSPIQAESMDELFGFIGRSNPQAIVLELSAETARERLVARGRADDASEEALKNRFSWYEAQVKPAIELLEKKGWAVHRIDGNATVDEVQKGISAALGLTV